MSKHDKTHVEEGFFNVHNRQLHELCDCLRDTHIFQKSEIALAIVSALMCNSVLHSPARAEDLLPSGFSTVTPTLVAGETLNDYFSGSLSAKGPYKFNYVSNSPDRVGYVNALVSNNAGTGDSAQNPLTMDFIISKSFPVEAFGDNQYLSLIGAYWAGNPDENETNFNYANDIFRNRELTVKLAKDVLFYANDIYAANQDKVKNVYAATLIKDFLFTKTLTQEFLANNGPSEDKNWIDLFSKVEGNNLKISLSSGAELHFQRIVGGKARTWRETSQGSGKKPWTYAYDNSVEIVGGTLEGKSTYDLDKSTTSPSGISPEDFKFYFRSSIIGGHGFLANNNSVYISDAIVNNISKKYGIVGGRAYDGVNVTKNTLYGCSANSNLIYINNSVVGKEDTDGGINIYAALSYGAATNNTAILQDSEFNGNVYGAAAALGSIMDRDENGGSNYAPNEAVPNGNHFYTYKGNVTTVEKDSLNNSQILYLFNKSDTQLDNKESNGKAQPNNSAFASKWVGLSDSNEISINNVTLPVGSSVYASAGILVMPSPLNNPTTAAFEDAKVVNLRRGTAYIGGVNTVSSVYAKNIIFGQYYTLNDQKKIELQKDGKTLKLGENISDTYIVNTSGFHSSLSQRSAGQSDVTNGMHNFWSGVTATLGTTMNGDGKVLSVNNKVYDGKEIVKRNFSLLALDNNDAEVDHYFANSAKLYLAISQGGENSAPIAINWSKIAEYRLSFASGGQFSPNGKLDFTKGGDTLPTFTEAYSPFPSVTILIGEDLKTGSLNNITPEKGLDDEYIKTIKNSSFDAQIAVRQSDTNGQDGIARTAAIAKFSIGQYLDFGEIKKADSNIDLPIYTPGSSPKQQTESFTTKDSGDYISYISNDQSGDWEGGISIRYRLKELELADSSYQLILYGLDLSESPINSSTSEDGYTLDAKLSQASGVDGGIVVYENQKVIIRTKYDDQTTHIYEELKGEQINHDNKFSGVTTVQRGSILEVIGNNALGTDDVHTNALYLHDNSQFNLGGYSQTIGSLNQYAAALSLNGEKTDQLGSLNISQTPNTGSYIRGSITGDAGSDLSVVNGTTTITSPNGTGYVGNFNVLSGTTIENSQPTSGGNPILFTTVYLASPHALDKATINAKDGTSLVFDNGGTDSNHVTVDIENGIRHYYAGTITAGAGYLFVSNPNIQVQNNGIVPHHLHVSSMNLNNTNLVFSTLFEKDGNGLVDNSQTDRIYVDGNASGAGNVLINALPGSEMGYTKANSGILLVSAPNADQNFKLSKGQVYIIQKNRLSRAADNDTDIKYELKSKNDPDGNFEDGAYKYWYLVSSVDGQSPDDKDHPTPSDPNDPVVEPIQPGDTTPSKDPDGSFTPGGTRPGHNGTQVRPQLAAFATNVLAWDKLNMRLHDRIGEAYFLDPETHELKKAAGWVRFQGTHSHAKVDRSARTTGNYMTTQVGTDILRTDLNEDWRLIGGVFFGNVYGRAHTNSLLTARSKVVGFGGGAYLTLFTGNSPDDGFYTDLWVSYNHFKNEVSGDEPSVKYHSKGMNYSGELGYTIHAATTGSASSQDKVDWYIQPQFQATLKGVKADNFTDWTGNRIKQDGKYNIQLRTGVRVFGRQSAQGNVFVEAN